MPSYRLTPPVIRWGATLQNAVYFPFPMDSVFSGSEPRPGSEQVQYVSGIRDAWRVGTDYILTGTHRWLAQSDTLYYPRCTGWDGASGLRAALEYLQDEHAFNWHPDGRNLITAPLMNADADANGIVDDFTSVGGTGVTFAFDGAAVAQKITVTGTTPTGFFYVYQEIPVIAGELLTFSAEYKVSGVTNAVGRIIIQALDSGGAGLDGGQAVDNLTATVFTRVGCPTYTVPAGVVHLRCFLEIHVTGATPAGSIWWRNAMVRRDSTDTTFVDNPRITGCYLVEPMQFSPANESDGSRQLVMKITNPASEFAGY